VERLRPYYELRDRSVDATQNDYDSSHWTSIPQYKQRQETQEQHNLEHMSWTRSVRLSLRSLSWLKGPDLVAVEAYPSPLLSQINSLAGGAIGVYIIAVQDTRAQLGQGGAHLDINVVETS